MHVLIDMPAQDPSSSALQALGNIRVDWVTPPGDKPRSLPSGQIRSCEALFCTFPPQNHAEMPRLRFIQISSSGYRQAINQGFPERGIRVCNALGVFDTPIAEWNIAMMIGLARDLRGMIRNQDAQVWDRSARFQAEIRGRVVGFWGYGGIARETARLAKTMGMRVHVFTRNGVRPRRNVYSLPGTGDPEGNFPDRVFLPAQKEDFLRSVDFLILSTPQTAATTGMVGEPELRQLRKDAFLLNPARGPLVQEPALIRALQEGWFAGAALDTHHHYPMPPDHPLWKMPNVIFTPHISGSSANPNFLDRIYDIFGQNLKRLLDGAPLLNELTPAQLRDE